VAAFIAEAGPGVRACFLGYPDMPLDDKLAFVVAAAGQPNDWLNRMGEAYVRTYVAGCIGFSRDLRQECQAVGLPFFDSGADFEGALAAAERSLVG